MDNHPNVEKIIHQLDIRPDQVLVQAIIIVRVDESLLRRLGIQWGRDYPTGK
ncbi:hypothetical protein [Coxiella-like endosymbiont]|uniref:hypothetical protein n=1 Tax=Coxiella-like endosymbiont TaxID=1592897 RepID=UPI00272DBD2C|nr:hypothetical protein [Coxiella-like endosymbiont]